MTEQAEYFKNRKEAHTWLVEEGFKISIGKFYEDCKQKGFPVVGQDGTVSKYQVSVYGRALTSDQAPDPSALERSEYAHRKEKADAKMAEMKAERMERDEDALWLHADDAWSALAAVIGNLRDAVRHAVHAAQVDIVQAAGGDVHRAPEVYEHVEQVINGAFNEVARQGIDVQWEEER